MVSSGCQLRQVSTVSVVAAVLLSNSLHGVDAWWKPTPGTSFQMQLTDTLDVSYDVAMFDLDLFDTSNSTIAELHGRGIKVICYFSAGTYENWRADKDKFTREMYGQELPDWENEFYVDTTSEAVRQVMVTRMELAKAKGCDGVDPDNVDAFLNEPGLNLTSATQLDYNKFLAKTAHDLDLAVGLKNDMAQIEDLVDDFDFAVNEECIEYNECDFMEPFLERNKAVFSIQYNGDRESGCKIANEMNMDTLYKSWDLSTERYSCREEAELSESSDSSSSASSASPTLYGAHVCYIMSAIVLFITVNT